MPNHINKSQIEIFATVLHLSLTKAKVYLTLLSKHSSTPSEIAKLTHLSRPTVYQSLENLEEIGFCYRTVGKNAVYKAVLPSEATKTFLRENELHLQKVRQIIEGMDDIYNSRHNCDVDDLIEIVRHPRVITRHHDRLCQWVTSEVVGLIPGPFDPDLIWENKSEVEAIKRGVTHRMIYEVSKEINSEAIKGMRYFAGNGEIIRVTSYLPMLMLVFDKTRTLSHFRDPKSGISGPPGIIIENPEYGSSMVRLFETYWAESIPLEAYLKTRKFS